MISNVLSPIPTAFNSSKPLGSFRNLAAKAALASLFLGAVSTLPAQASPSSITRYALNYTTTNGVGSLNGYFDIDTSTAPTVLTQDLFSNLSSWFLDLNLTYFDGSSTVTYTAADFNYLTWDPASSVIDWNASLLGQFNTIGIGLDPIVFGVPQNAPIFASTGGTPFLQTDASGNNEYTLTGAAPEVPGPLPILGVGSAFAFSRRLRNRQRISLRVVKKSTV
jgi:hypothetical protein